ncbi:Dabb family protein [Amycolatopsis sp. NPDC049252]|uniref:Dabb family protein n=1 Tax=Amycolatopsis sp. NPDC049252 TaxID=3363933 RepID=UPI00372454AF
MISHIVCFRFKPGVTWDDPRAAEAEKITREHPDHITEIRSWSVGRNTTVRTIAYDFALVGRFHDREALERYMVHPDHRRGVRAWSELSTWVAVDLDHSQDALIVEPVG